MRSKGDDRIKDTCKLLEPLSLGNRSLDLIREILAEKNWRRRMTKLVLQTTIEIVATHQK